jgi:hypothetical protein
VDLNYPLQKLPTAGTIMFLNDLVLELSFARAILCRNCSLQAIIFFISHRLDPVSFEHLVLAPLCEPKSHHIIAVRMRKMKNTLNLFSKKIRYCQIF